MNRKDENGNQMTMCSIVPFKCFPAIPVRADEAVWIGLCDVLKVLDSLPAQWEITHDHVAMEGEKSDVGLQGPREFIDPQTVHAGRTSYKLPIPMPHRFRMRDDDGELYYSGVCSKEDFAPLDDFGLPNAGAVTIEYLNPRTGEYEAL